MSARRLTVFAVVVLVVLIGSANIALGQAASVCRVEIEVDEFTGERTVSLNVNGPPELERYEGDSGQGSSYISLKAHQSGDINISFSYSGPTVTVTDDEGILVLIDGERIPNLTILEAFVPEIAGSSIGFVGARIGMEFLEQIANADDVRIRIPFDRYNFERALGDIHRQCVDKFLAALEGGQPSSPQRPTRLEPGANDTDAPVELALADPTSPPQQIPAVPLPGRSDVLVTPAILQQGVQWTDRRADAVGYLWGAEVQNNNEVPIIATVVLRLHDAADEVIHEDDYELVLAPGDSKEFDEEGEIPESVATRASHWTFDATARPFEPAPPPSDQRDEARPPPANEAVALAPATTPLQVVDVQAKPTEVNDTWWRMAWQLTVRNTTRQGIELDATIEFLDADGFVVDDTREYGVSVPGGSSRTFTGYDLVDTNAAVNVVGVKAKLRYDGGEIESSFDPADMFPIRLQVRHRHFASAPQGTLVLYEDRIEFSEFGNAEHRFSVPTHSVTKLDYSVLDDSRLTWTLHFSVETAVGDKATVSLDMVGRVQLILFVNRHCPNAEILIQ